MVGIGLAASVSRLKAMKLTLTGPAPAPLLYCSTVGELTPSDALPRAWSLRK